MIGLHSAGKKHDAAISSKQLALLKQLLSKPVKGMPIKPDVISDARNYLNALPTGYLYYSLAKETFPNKKQKIAVEGFNLATTELPIYFTKSGYREISKKLPHLSTLLQQENWVLDRQDLTLLPSILIEAYSLDYVTWWQNFMRKSQPLHYQDYQQGHEVTQLLQQSNTFTQLVQLIQEETKPDLLDNSSTFNNTSRVNLLTSI